VRFDIVSGEKGDKAINVTGLYGGPVKGSPHVANRIRIRGSGYYRRSRSTGGGDEGSNSKSSCYILLRYLSSITVPLTLTFDMSQPYCSL